MSYKILAIVKQDFLQLGIIKTYLRISHDYDDQWITELICGAISAAENFLRIRLLPIKLRICVQYLHQPNIILPFVPVAEILAVTAHAGLRDIVLREEYELDKNMIKLRNAPSHDYLTIDYIAGYQDQTQIPAAIKQGIMLHIAEMYDSRGTIASISHEVQKLYQPYRQMML